MARVNAAHLAFNRGEVSKIALARIDVAKLQLAAQVQVNFLPFVVGPMMLRPGMMYVGETYLDRPAWLIDFAYSKSDVALLELTDSLLRVYINDALVSRVAVLTAVADPGFAGLGSWSTADSTAGTTITIVGGVATLLASARGSLARIKQTIAVAGADQNKEHGLRVVVTAGPVTIRAGSSAGLADYIATTALDVGTHSIPFTPTGANVFLQIETTDQWAKSLTQVTIDTAGTLTLPTPWLAADLSTLQWTQSNDILYVGCYGKQQYKIERRGVRPYATGWSVVKYRSSNGPFLNGPTIKANLKPSVYEGNGTLTADKNFFQSGHVDALFRLFIPGQVNLTNLVGDGAFSDPIRVSGVGNDRKFGWTVAGTWTGTLTLQRSLIGPDAGYTTVGTVTVGGTTSQDDSATLNNVIAWYRVGFLNAGDYATGVPQVSFTDTGGISKGGVANGAACDAGGRYGICRVTSYTSPTVVNIEVLEPFPSLRQTLNWQESAWSGAQGWPTSPAIFEGRMCWLGGVAMPIVHSESNDFTGFAVADKYGLPLGDAGAILENFGEGPADRINFALSLTRLLAGREGSVASIRSSAFDTTVTAATFSVKDCARQPADRLRAVKAGKNGIFVSGSKLYELSWAPAHTDYADRDLSRLNVDIGAPGFVDIDLTSHLDSMVYLPLANGHAAALLYDPADEVEAFWRIQTLGVIENVRVIQNPTATEDQVYFVVKRTMSNGGTRRYIEKLAPRSACVGGLLNKQLDCAVSYTGAASTTVTLAHLPLMPVSIWGNGVYQGTAVTDSNGVATLPFGASCNNIVAGLAGATVTYSGAAAVTTMAGLDAYNGIPGVFFADQQPSGRMRHVGTLTPSSGSVSLPNGWSATSIVGFFGFQGVFMSAKLGYGAQMGSPINQKKKIDHVGLALYDVGGQALQFGQRFDHLDNMPLYEDSAAVANGTIWGEYDQPVTELPGEWDSDARLCLLATAPNPVKVGAAVIAVTTNEK